LLPINDLTVRNSTLNVISAWYNLFYLHTINLLSSIFLAASAKCLMDDLIILNSN